MMMISRRMSFHICFMVAIVLVMDDVRATCPSLEDLSNENAFPDISQVNSNAALIQWPNLWQGMNWTECVATLSMVKEVEGSTAAEEIRIDDVNSKNMSLLVEPCKGVRFKIQVRLKESDEVLKSFGTDRNFKTYRNPEAKPNPKITVRYHQEPSGQLNLTAVDIHFRFQDIADDPGCKRVERSELRFKTDSSDIWTVFKTYGVYRSVKETLVGLVDICRSYEIVLQLVGKPGTEGTLVPLHVLPSVKPELLKSAYDTGFQMPIQPPLNLTLVKVTQSTIEMSWINTWTCLTGYFLELLDGSGDVLQHQQLSDPLAVSFQFADLSSCSEFRVELRGYLKITEKINEFSPIVTLSATTLPQDSASSEAQLLSLRTTVASASISLSWSDNEFPCFRQMSAKLCPVSDKENCIQPFDDRKIYKRSVARFRQLLPCTSYLASIFPVDENGINFQKTLTTDSIQRAPKNLDVYYSNETTITLGWVMDTCASAYVISYTSDSSKSYDGIRYISANEIATANSLHLHHIGGQDKRRVRRENLAFNMDMEYDYEADYHAMKQPIAHSGDFDTSDDEDYASANDFSGSGFGDEEGSGGELPEYLTDDDQHYFSLPVVVAHIDNLQPCTEYHFKVQSSYNSTSGKASPFGKASHISSSTACNNKHVESSLEMQLDKEDIHEMEECMSAFYAKEIVSDNETLIEVTWKQLQNVTSRLEIASVVEDRNFTFSEIYVTAQLEEGSDYISEVVPVDPCDHYQIHVFWLRSEEESLVWSSNLTTSPDKTSSITLTNFEIGINEAPKRGLAVAKWIHNHYCVTKYKVEVSDESKKGEILIEAPRMQEQVEIDLHMLPGLLNLVNCQWYDLVIVPISKQETSLGISTWHKVGFQHRFQHATEEGMPANVNPPGEVISAQESGANILLTFKEPISCQPVQVDLSLQQYQIETNSETYDLVQQLHLSSEDQNEYQIKDLNPCSSYKVAFKDQNGSEIFSEIVKTKRQAGVSVPKLQNSEVTVWKEENTVDIQVQWIDKCSDYYIFSYCSHPCSLETIERLKHSESSIHPTTVLEDLDPCKSYAYKIKDNTNFTLFESKFTTIFLPYLNYEPEMAVSDDFILSWKNKYPCLIDLLITIENDNKESLDERLVPIQDNNLNLSRVFPELELEQCSNYPLKVKPQLSRDYEDALWEEGSVQHLLYFHFNRPEPPKHVNITHLNDTSVLFQWEALPCYSQYLAEVTSKESGKIQGSRIGEARLMTENLRPCTQYQLKIWSIANESTSTDSLSTFFTTDHSDEIKIRANAGYTDLQVIPQIHGNDCVDRYEVHLCNYETIRECWNKTLIANEVDAVVFEDLTAGTPYVYQIYGYMDTKVAFISQEHFVETKPVIRANLAVSMIAWNSIQLHLNASIFHLEDNNAPTDWYSIVNCTANGVTTSQQVNETSITFDNLIPESRVTCSGIFFYDNEAAEIDMVNATVESGIAGPPQNLSVLELEDGKVRIGWEEPTPFNGTILEYKVLGRPQCYEPNESCDESCPEPVTVLTSKMEATVLVAAFTSYQFNVSARTRTNPFGAYSEAIEVDTLPSLAPPAMIDTVQQLLNNSVEVTFTLACPLKGNFELSVHYQCVNCNSSSSISIPNPSVNYVVLSELLGGHFYDIWLESRLTDCPYEGCGAQTEKFLIFVDCEYKCRDGTCIKEENICDQISHCDDKSDEENCVCEPPDRFQCKNGFCIKASDRCNGYIDCGDSSDEADCPHCNNNEFMCESTGVCIPKNYTCDRKIHCPDGSDEYGCAYWKSMCWPEKFRCFDHTCIDVKRRCDGIWDCKGGEDELSCASTCTKGGTFACRNGSCVDHAQYCDGIEDCTDGSDEYLGCNCHKYGQFACNDGAQCIPRLQVCDGSYDCKDRTDEKYCGQHPNSTGEATEDFIKDISKGIEKEFENDTRTEEINNEVEIYTNETMEETWRSEVESTTASWMPPSTRKFTDADQNMTQQDEPVSFPNSRNQKVPKKKPKSVKKSNDYKLRVYPKLQEVSDGNDIVIQCRDEGRLRARVSWRRKSSGLKLPTERVKMDRGRLIVAKARRKDSGIYECFVVGDQSTSVSSEVRVKNRWRRF